MFEKADRAFLRSVSLSICKLMAASAALVPAVQFYRSGGDREPFVYRRPALQSYEQYKGMSLDEMMEGVIADGLTDGLTVADVLLKISQDAERYGATKPFTVEEADRVKREMYEAADTLAARLSVVRFLRGGPPSTVNKIRAFNSVLFADRHFRFPKPGTTFHPAVYPNMNLVEVWNNQTGVCEDTTGVYQCIADILHDGGVPADVQAIFMPGHIAIAWDGGDTCVETTAGGLMVEKDAYAKLYEIDPDEVRGYLRPCRFGAVAAELNNHAVHLMRNESHTDCDTMERAIDYYRWAIRLTPDVPMLHKSVSHVYLTKFHSGRRAPGDLESALRHINTALELDRRTRDIYIDKSRVYLAKVECGTRQRTADKLRYLKRALKQYKKALPIRCERACHDGDGIVWLYMSRLHLTRFMITGYMSDACATLVAANTAVRKGLQKDARYYRVRANTFKLMLEATGEWLDFFKARKYYSQGIAEAGGHGIGMLLSLYAGRGGAYLAWGDYVAAVRDYNRALRIASRYQMEHGCTLGLFIGAGLGHLRLGNKEEAVWYFRKAIETHGLGGCSSIRDYFFYRMRKGGKWWEGYPYMKCLMDEIMHDETAAALFADCMLKVNRSRYRGLVRWLRKTGAAVTTAHGHDA